MALLEMVQEAGKTLLGMPCAYAFVGGVLVLEWAIRTSSRISNRVIPLVVIGLMMAVIPILIPERPDPTLRHPVLADWVRRVSVGAMAGLLTWGGSGVVFRIVARVLPALDAENATKEPPTSK